MPRKRDTSSSYLFFSRIYRLSRETLRSTVNYWHSIGEKEVNGCYAVRKSCSRSKRVVVSSFRVENVYLLLARPFSSLFFSFLWVLAFRPSPSVFSSTSERRPSSRRISVNSRRTTTSGISRQRLCNVADWVTCAPNADDRWSVCARCTRHVIGLLSHLLDDVDNRDTATMTTTTPRWRRTVRSWNDLDECTFRFRMFPSKLNSSDVTLWLLTYATVPFFTSLSISLGAPRNSSNFEIRDLSASTSFSGILRSDFSTKNRPNSWRDICRRVKENMLDVCEENTPNFDISHDASRFNSRFSMKPLDMI